MMQQYETTPKDTAMIEEFEVNPIDYEIPFMAPKTAIMISSQVT